MLYLWKYTKVPEKRRFICTARSWMTTDKELASPTNDIGVTRWQRHMTQTTKSVMRREKKLVSRKMATNDMSSRQMATCRQHFQLSPCPNKKVVNESIDENIFIFWKEFNHFSFRTGLTAIIQVTLKLIMLYLVNLTFGMRCILSHYVNSIKNGLWANIGGESLMKRSVLYTSARVEETQQLRNLNSSKDPNYDVFGDDNLK